MKNVLVDSLQSVALLALKGLSICLGTMAFGGIFYAFYRIITDNLI